MESYAEVIVDIPVTILDRIYDYHIPDGLVGRIETGQAVLVPFGRRKVTGFIVGLKDEPGIEIKKVRDIADLIRPEPLFDRTMLELMKWVAVYYKSPLIKVIRTAIPTGLINGKVKKKRVNYLILNQSVEESREIAGQIEGRAPSQAGVLRVLLEENGVLTRAELARKAGTTPGTVTRLLEKGYILYRQGVEERRPVIKKAADTSGPLNPTPAQAGHIKTISARINRGLPGFFLLHGVTGSGKTEVYLQVIEEALKAGRGAVMLVPEISLTPVTVSRFYSRFGEKVAVLHSNLSLGERYDEWRRLKRGEARVAVGVRSAVFAPVKDPGVIIIDEEHENSYKQGESPYYHAREVAMQRGKLTEIPVILGSATPSLESFYRAREGKIDYLSLPQRIFQEDLPPVKIVDMREELKEGNTSFLSRELHSALEDALERGEQALIFLNRRGYASFVLCRECGMVIKCRNCDISLTYHAGSSRLCCHYCDYTEALPEVCPECGSRYIRNFGLGTERVEEELAGFFPEAVIERMDHDTTTRKGSHRQILERLEKGKTDILVGTQMIAKGHDYPNISVVGVISADTILNLPDFRSAERTFQLLTQVAGRTGRGEKKGLVYIQTYTPDHYSIQEACQHNYTGFYEEEIMVRQRLSYPPFTHLANIIIQGYQEEEVSSGAEKLGIFLRNYHRYIQEILGPSPAPISKIRKRYRWQIILKFSGWKERNYVLRGVEKEFISALNSDLNFNIDVDPIMML